MKNSSCGFAVLKNSTTASRARSILLLMLPLMSKITPIETGASSLENVLISCRSLPSKRLKFSRSRPVTRRFNGSVMVTGTRTMSTSTLKGLVWVLSAGSMSGSFGGGGWTRGWMCTSSVKFWARSGRALPTATTRKTAKETRAENCLPHNIGPTHISANARLEGRRPPSQKPGHKHSTEPDSSTISKEFCHLLDATVRFDTDSEGCYRLCASFFSFLAFFVFAAGVGSSLLQF